MMLVELVLGVLAAMIVVMIAAWAFGLAMKDGGWTDVFWTWGTGLSLAAAALCPNPGTAITPRQGLVAGFMVIWMLRLGLYITPRVISHPEDPRYAAFREQFGKRYPLYMLFVTMPQAPATALLSLSVILAARAPEAGTSLFSLRDLAAALVFAGAIVGEYVSDEQMRRYRADKSNKGGIMDQGLWAYSRHPNYFFQWLGWCAYPVIALDPARPVTLLSLAAPAVMFVLLRFVSGVPPLEQSMLKTRGDKFRSYQRRVSAFFPLPPKAKA